MTDEQVASVVHAANCAIQALDGDECPSPPWESLDPQTRALTVRGVRLARLGMTPERLHEAWCDGKRAQGWVHGESKDPVARTHPCMIPYADLPEHQRAKDRLLSVITRELAGPQRLRAAS